MAHIHTGPGEHDQTVSAYILWETSDGVRLLMHRHKYLPLTLQPAGHVELTEDPWTAVLREICEETGYGLNQLQVFQPADRMKGDPGDDAVLHPQPVCVLTHGFGPEGTHFHTDMAFAFIVNGPPTGRPGVGESTSFIWVSAEEAKHLPDVPENVRSVVDYIFTTVYPTWECGSL